MRRQLSKQKHVYLQNHADLDRIIKELPILAKNVRDSSAYIATEEDLKQYHQNLVSLAILASKCAISGRDQQEISIGKDLLFKLFSSTITIPRDGDINSIPSETVSKESNYIGIFDTGNDGLVTNPVEIIDRVITESPISFEKDEDELPMKLAAEINAFKVPIIIIDDSFLTANQNTPVAQIDTPQSGQAASQEDQIQRIVDSFVAPLEANDTVTDLLNEQESKNTTHDVAPKATKSEVRHTVSEQTISQVVDEHNSMPDLKSKKSGRILNRIKKIFN